MIEIRRGNVSKRGQWMNCSIPSKRVWRVTVWKPGTGVKATIYTRSIRRASLVAVLLILAGCSTFRPQPATGLMWGYFGESQPIPSLRGVVYTLDRPTCEVGRAKDVYPSPAAEWAGMRFPDECRQLIVGAGTDYWVFAVSGQGAVGANGASDREWCVKMREATAGSYRGLLGECQPVAVTTVP